MGGRKNILQTMEGATRATVKSMRVITLSATVALQSPPRLVRSSSGNGLGWVGELVGEGS